jgi:hypothetical protein
VDSRIREQLLLAERFGAEPVVPAPEQRLGIAPNAREGIWPINGLRHPPAPGMCGWYIWAGGDIPQDDDEYFASLHVSHIEEWCVPAIPYLALPPGYRFLISPGFEDVWFDEVLLEDTG